MVTNIFEQIGSTEKVMISFVGHGHMMVTQPQPAKQIKHFVTRLFGYYLRDQEQYFDIFSEDFLDQFDDLAWGVYVEE
jgi:hypothetical protein